MNADQSLSGRVVFGWRRWWSLDGEDAIAGYVRDYLIGIVSAGQKVLPHKVPLHQAIGTLVATIVISLDDDIVVIGFDHNVVRMKLSHIDVNPKALLIHMDTLTGIVVVPSHWMRPLIRRRLDQLVAHSTRHQLIQRSE